MAPAPKPSRAAWLAVVVTALACGSAWGRDGKIAPSAQPKPSISPRVQPRSFRTFLPKPGEAIDDPASQVVQVLLDRQNKGGFDSYMVQVLFRGKPSDRAVRILTDRVEIDFFDTGKPSIRFSKIRGGVVEASSVDEFYYRENTAKAGMGHPVHIKRMVRLTLFMHEKVDLKFRDTLDRTLIHFRQVNEPVR
ncbi:MAG: hypothetical protein M3Y08_10775 [Fibrobacterota bacterium]|nr:hypothetical protein [Fibrobacterota bacterium]